MSRNIHYHRSWLTNDSKRKSKHIRQSTSQRIKKSKTSSPSSNAYINFYTFQIGLDKFTQIKLQRSQKYTYICPYQNFLKRGNFCGFCARANFSAFRTFVRFVLVLFCRFFLPLGVWEGLLFVIVAFPGLFSYPYFCILPKHSRTICLNRWSKLR